MVKHRTCDICGEKIICSLLTDALTDVVGYCENCCFCQETNCTQRVAFRVNHSYDSGSIKFTMMHDLCQKHADFFPGANSLNKQPFVYFESS